jgi:hypothetical protein
MDLQIHNISIKYNIWQNISDLGILQIVWPISMVESIYYTLVIHNVETNFINVMVINIPGNNINQGNYIVPYIVPNPTNGRYTYRITVFKQESIIDGKENLSWFGSRFDFDSLQERNKEIVIKFIKYYRLSMFVNDTLIVDGDAKLYYRSHNNEIQSSSIPINTDFESLGIGGLNNELMGLVMDVIAPRLMTKEMKD